MRRRRRAREGHHVLAGEVLEEVPNCAADQLHRSFRQDRRLDDPPESLLGEVAGLRRRLHDGRHAGEERRGEFLEHPPHRKIEGVDVHRRALERRADVLPHEAAALRQRFDPTIDVHAAVRELPHSLARVHEERANAAVDVDPRIALGGPSRIGERVELLLVLGEVAGERLEERRALVESEPPQVPSAHLARMLEHQPRIEAVRGRAGDDLARGGIAQRNAAARPGKPLSRHETLQLHARHSPPTT